MDLASFKTLYKPKQPQSLTTFKSSCPHSSCYPLHSLSVDTMQTSLICTLKSFNSEIDTFNFTLYPVIGGGRLLNNSWIHARTPQIPLRTNEVFQFHNKQNSKSLENEKRYDHRQCAADKSTAQSRLFVMRINPSAFFRNTNNNELPPWHVLPSSSFRCLFFKRESGSRSEFPPRLPRINI